MKALILTFAAALTFFSVVVLFSSPSKNVTLTHHSQVTPISITTLPTITVRPSTDGVALSRVVVLPTITVHPPSSGHVPAVYSGTSAGGRN